MMFHLGPENWLRLFVWLILGLVIYFGYSRRHSELRRQSHWCHPLISQPSIEDRRAQPRASHAHWGTWTALVSKD